jgi:hypothetical protein
MSKRLTKDEKLVETIIKVRHPKSLSKADVVKALRNGLYLEAERATIVITWPSNSYSRKLHRVKILRYRRRDVEIYPTTAKPLHKGA